VVALRRDIEDAPAAVEASIARALPLPLFVKPCNMGSSVGVSKVKAWVELGEALREAARYDRRVLVEEGVEGAREIEVAVLGNDAPEASVPGEIVPGAEFYDYRAKYLDDSSTLHIPADLPAATTARVRDLALRAFRAVDGAGMARVDFFYQGQADRLLVNEINTIPGFTKISMYPKLWEATGVPYADLVDRLVDLAIERHRDRARSATSYAGKPPGPSA
jgi:D-alanine-D-alanine ligase